MLDQLDVEEFHIRMPIHKKNLGPSSYMAGTARFRPFQLEAKQQYVGMVDQCHDDSSHAVKGSTNTNHACYLGDLEGEKC